MKRLLLILIASLFLIQANAQKQKINFKKEIIFVDKVEWGKFERVGNKYILSTLEGTEYVSINHQSFGTERYHTNGKEIHNHYIEVHFFETEIPMFEMNNNLKQLVRLLIKNGVITEDGSFDEEKAKKFKEKYQENISEQRFLTK